jgi:hypothetical protein
MKRAVASAAVLFFEVIFVLMKMFVVWSFFGEIGRFIWGFIWGVWEFGSLDDRSFRFLFGEFRSLGVLCKQSDKVERGRYLMRIIVTSATPATPELLE